MLLVGHVVDHTTGWGAIVHSPAVARVSFGLLWQDVRRLSGVSLVMSKMLQCDLGIYTQEAVVVVI